MPKARTYERSSWTRPNSGDRGKLVQLHAWLRDELGPWMDQQLDAWSGAETPPFTREEFREWVQALREWIELSAPGEGTRGAALRDTERDVMYRVTLDRTQGSTGLRTVEVETPEGSDDLSVFRLPVSQLRAQTAALSASQESMERESGRQSIVIGDRDQPITFEALAELVCSGVPRAEIADRYGRHPSRIDQLIREGRRTRPDLNWPQPKSGPKPKRSGTT